MTNVSSNNQTGGVTAANASAGGAAGRELRAHTPEEIELHTQFAAALQRMNLEHDNAAIALRDEFRAKLAALKEKPKGA